jgi:glucokinase
MVRTLRAPGARGTFARLMSLVAIDLGGTKLASALFSLDGELLRRASVPLAARTGREVGTLIVEQVTALESSVGGVTAVGVAVPGTYRAERGTVWAPNIPGWDDYPLLEELSRAFGPGVTVRIDSDRAACVLGEAWCGAARGCENIAFVTVGTGIGVGLLVDGRVLRGHADIAGAIGWLAVRQPYVPGYRACGCLEYHASGPGLLKVARERGSKTTNTNDLFDAYDAGDPIATTVLDDAVAFWGMMAANLVSLFNPQMIVFGGGIFGPAARFLDRIRDEAAQWAQPIGMRQVRFVVSALGGDAPLYGAASLVLSAAQYAPQRERVT